MIDDMNKMLLNDIRKEICKSSGLHFVTFV